MRAISTVLDVAVFLLLLSAAIGTLVVAPTGEPAPVTVDETATTLATTTTALDYDLHGDPRRAHGTVAVLLARAAVANATIGDYGLSPSESFLRGIRQTTRSRTPDHNRTQVVARWEPYRGAPLAGKITVGTSPPAGTDVTTATLTVTSPVESVGEAEGDAKDRDYCSVARVTAEAVTEALLPETRLAASAGAQSPTALVSAQRFQFLASALDVDIKNSLQRGNVTRANALVTNALADRFCRDMRERFASPTAAAKAGNTATVNIVVRRWDG